MKTLRFFATIVAFFIVIILQAQTQQGYVKTLGRPNQKGVALSGVTIRVKGGHNAVLSNQQGVFSMPMPHKKNGDTYQLQQVQKQGYELNEQDVIGRPYAFSDKIPLTITMVNSHQLQADKQRIENKAYEVAEKTYKSRLNALEKQRDANSITIENYREQLQQLQNHFDKYQSLIDDLADHYARVDFDNLDEAERKVNVCIENGELEQADLLLQQLGVYKRVEEINRRLQSGEKLMEEANQDMALVLKQQDKDAEYLYQLYTIALAKFDNEKARFYIETRAALDTTNVEWQNQVGEYIHYYIGDTKEAIRYFKTALRQSLQQYGEENIWTAIEYNNVGGEYKMQGNYSKALEFYTKALVIWEKVAGKEHPDVAKANINIGSVYYLQGDYVKAFDYFSKALTIQKKTLKMEHPDIAVNYSHLGGNYAAQGNYLKAFEYYNKSLTIVKKIYGEEHFYTADLLNEIGCLFSGQGDYSKALEYHFKSLAIREKVLSYEHPSVATSYNNIGITYQKQGNITKAVEYYSRALLIYEKLYGTGHPNTATFYNNIGSIYKDQGDYTKALEYYTKSLNIRLKVLGNNHPDVAGSYNNIGSIYKDQADYAKALEYYTNSLNIRLKVLGNNHPDVAVSYYNLGAVYSYMGKYSKALNNFSKAFDIFRKVLGPDHPNTKSAEELVNTLKGNE